MPHIPTIDLVKTGQNISRLRKQAGLSVHELQLLCGLSSAQAVYKWQHGTALPTVDNLVVLSVILGVSIDSILIVE